MAKVSEGRAADADPRDLLPLKPADFQILLVLAETELHGYGIMKEVERQSGGRVRLELGSLYRLISRLLDSGLIEQAIAPAGVDADSRRRRFYRITEFGRRVAEAEADRLAEVVEAARTRLVARVKKA